jgi:plasmid maintenance system antidote protein VapI|tara:strand:+ start:162 stop:359 length:198 start_codon:yes stop_codon:yes gene_type:complete
MSAENPLWEDNSIQFPRLIAEINACVDISPENWRELQESMDLTEDEIIQLFDRAHDKWEKIKAEV